MTEKNEFFLYPRVLLAATLGALTGFSSTWLYSSGLFIIPVSESFGLSRGEASLSPLICMLIVAVLSPVTGRIVDRIGAGPVAIFSLVGLAFGFVMISIFAVSFTSYILLAMLIAVLGVGSTTVSFSRLVVDNFIQRRGTALAIMFCGTGLGAILVPLLLSQIISSEGWRAGYQALAVTIVVFSVIIVFLLKGANARGLPPKTSQPKPLTGLWLNPLFLLFSSIFFLVSAGIFSVIVHFVPMIIEYGFTASQAGFYASFIGFATIPSRLMTGMLLDKFPAHFVTSVLFFTVSVGFLVLAFGGPAVMPLAAIICGMAIGAEIDLLAFLVSRNFPKENYAQVYGWLFGVVAVGGALGPGVAGYMYDLTGTYELSVLIAFGCVFVSAMLILITPRLSRRHQHDGRKKAAPLLPEKNR